MVPENTKLGQRIKQAIDNSDYQAKECAEYVGVTPQAISQAIRKNAMREPNLRKLAEFTGCDVEWLIHGEREAIANFDIDLMSRCAEAIKNAAEDLGMTDLNQAEITQAAYRLYKANS